MCCTADLWADAKTHCLEDGNKGRLDARFQAVTFMILHHGFNRSFVDEVEEVEVSILAA